MENVRRKARDIAFRTIYAWDINGGNISEIVKEIINMEEKPLKRDIVKYANLIISKFENNIESIDKEIASYLENWTFDDMGAIEKAVLRTSFTEYLYIKPKKQIAALTDYLNITNTYSTPKSTSFINGVLSSLIKAKYNV
jgi:N utilization substance protein B